jgi:hypothetical protein
MIQLSIPQLNEIKPICVIVDWVFEGTIKCSIKKLITWDPS